MNMLMKVENGWDRRLESIKSSWLTKITLIFVPGYADMFDGMATVGIR